MADYSTREVTTTRKEYILPTPSMIGELRKMIAHLESDLGDEKASWDDCARVEVNDEGGIVLSHEVAGDD